MNDTFTNETIPCPHCWTLPEFQGNDKRGRPKSRWVPSLEVSERNYSGCSVDIANCPECGKGYQVSYQVSSVDRAPEWDSDSRSEQDARKKEVKKYFLKLAKEDVIRLEKAVKENE